jgi:hypothetical protein
LQKYFASRLPPNQQHGFFHPAPWRALAIVTNVGECEGVPRIAVIARSASDEAIHAFFLAARWIASLALAMTVSPAVVTRESG